MNKRTNTLNMPTHTSGVVKPDGSNVKNILGVNVCTLTRENALEMIEMFVVEKQHRKIAFLNSHGANLAFVKHDYQRTLENFIVLADGVGIDLGALALYGKKFPNNLNGTDFIPSLMTFIKVPLRVGLVGAAPGVVEKSALVLEKEHNTHEFIPISDGYFTINDIPKIMKQIEESKLDILLIALGNPLQEEWIADHCTAKHCTVAIGVGAFLDFTSGLVPRAPQWMRTLRLEWVFRLKHEPTRMWRRYLIGNPLFFQRILRQKLFGQSVGE